MREVMLSWVFIMAIAMPEKLPDLFENPDFDPDNNPEDQKKYVSMVAALPNAVKAIEDHIPRQKQGIRGAAPRPVNLFPASSKIGRNDPCPCGSGKKYKKCCGMN